MNPRPVRRSQIRRRRLTPRRSSRVLNPEYLAFIRLLPCAICYADAYRFLGMDIAGVCEPGALYGRQKSPTEAAHVGLSGKPRGMSQKCSDDEAIPLCGTEHHREGEFSIHRIGPAAFFAQHGADRDEVIRLFRNLYAEHCR